MLIETFKIPDFRMYFVTEFTRQCFSNNGTIKKIFVPCSFASKYNLFLIFLAKKKNFMPKQSSQIFCQQIFKLSFEIISIITHPTFFEQQWRNKESFFLCSFASTFNLFLVFFLQKKIKKFQCLSSLVKSFVSRFSNSLLR
jgi:hypothetical protein